MSTTKDNKLHPEVLKLFNSPIYRRKIKRAVETIKTYHLLHQKKLTRRGNSLTPDKSTAHYFSQSTDVGHDRRNSQHNSKQ